MFSIVVKQEVFVFKILLCTLLKTKTDFLPRFNLHSYMVTQERSFNALKRLSGESEGIQYVNTLRTEISCIPQGSKGFGDLIVN